MKFSFQTCSPGYKQLQCRICGVRFSHAHTLRYHIKVQHTGAKPYACVCGVAFQYSEQRKRHRNKCPIFLAKNQGISPVQSNIEVERKDDTAVESEQIDQIVTTK